MVGQRPPGQCQATHRGLCRPGNPATGALPGGVICSPPRRQPRLAAEGTGALAAESGTRVGAQATGQTLRGEGERATQQREEGGAGDWGREANPPPGEIKVSVD